MQLSEEAGYCLLLVITILLLIFLIFGIGISAGASEVDPVTVI